MNRLVSFFIIFSVCLAGTAQANNVSYVLAARQNDLLKTQNRIADMTANVNTTAFKVEKDVYAAYPVRMDDRSRVDFSTIDQTKRDATQGSFISTGRQLDVAISGRGYFMVNTPRGTRYTRAGNLAVSPEGVLVTKEGYPLIGPGGGQVEFAPEDNDVTVREDGLVTVGLEERGQIGVFIFENEQLMYREGQSLYRTDQSPTPYETAKVYQGVLEASNVSSVIAMTDLVEVSRNIEQTKQLQQDFHDLQLNIIRTLSKQ